MVAREARRRRIIALESVITDIVTILFIVLWHVRARNRLRYTRRGVIGREWSMGARVPRQLAYLSEIVGVSDIACINNLRMSRNAFGRLCTLVHSAGGLQPTKIVSVQEQLAMFLSILAHHKKNRVIGHNFVRSGRTVSKYFSAVLYAIIKLHQVLYAKPVPVAEDGGVGRWSCFKGCLGALDGTYVPVRVPAADRGRYRNRKGDISMNVLGVCDRDMKFVYVLSGWEGSAADSRVLRDAVSRPSGLQIRRGTYYLCDNGYSNSEGFLTPYKSVRYHLNEWADGLAAPRNKEEYFNMRHSRARSVIERAFGLIKARWAILRSPSFYPPKTHSRIVLACCLLHNFIRMEMEFDPAEELYGEMANVNDSVRSNVIDSVESSSEWNVFRNQMAASMYESWCGSRDL